MSYWLLVLLSCSYSGFFLLHVKCTALLFVGFGQFQFILHELCTTEDACPVSTRQKNTQQTCLVHFCGKIPKKKIGVTNRNWSKNVKASRKRFGATNLKLGQKCLSLLHITWYAPFHCIFKITFFLKLLTCFTSKASTSCGWPGLAMVKCIHHNGHERVISAICKYCIYSHIRQH